MKTVIAFFFCAVMVKANSMGKNSARNLLLPEKPKTTKCYFELLAGSLEYKMIDVIFFFRECY